MKRAATLLAVICEVSDRAELTLTSRELLGLGRRLADATSRELAAVLIGETVRGAAEKSIRAGASFAFIVEDAHLGEYVPSIYLAAVEKILAEFSADIVLGGHTVFCQDLLPRLAAKLDTEVVTDCTAVDFDERSGALLLTKPIYGGNALAVFECTSTPQLATVRRGVGVPLMDNPERKGEVVSLEMDVSSVPPDMRVVGRVREETDGVKLEDAEIVVSGGRGVGSADGFQHLRELAKLLGAGLGASRPPCDMGWMPSSSQVGLTGKVVGPNLYLAVGISGAMQHLTGMTESRRVAAINKDADANIFKVADYGVVGDYRKVLPAFTERLRKLMNIQAEG